MVTGVVVLAWWWVCGNRRCGGLGMAEFGSLVLESSAWRWVLFRLGAVVVFGCEVMVLVWRSSSLRCWRVRREGRQRC